jgi:hypothetical protein
LSVVSLLGASLLIGLGWWAFTDLAKATKALDEETRRTGESSIEYKDVRAFLDTTRNIFTSLEIYPERYAGLFGVTRDELALAKKQLNILAANYSDHYTEEVLEPVRRDLSRTEQAILKLEEFAFSAKDSEKAEKKNFWKNRSNANIKYEKTRDELKRSLENIEVESETFRAQSEQEVWNKWDALKDQEDRNAIFLLLAVERD